MTTLIADIAVISNSKILDLGYAPSNACVTIEKLNKPRDFPLRLHV